MDKDTIFDVLTYERNFSNGVCVVKKGDNVVFMSETDNDYVKQVYPPDPLMVATQTTYFADTLQVHSEGTFIKGWNIEIGIWRYYDRDGSLIQEINKDENYPLAWDVMRNRFLSHGIDIFNLRLLCRVYDQDRGRYLWSLTLNSTDEVFDMAFFDAETGNLIDRKQTTFKIK